MYHASRILHAFHTPKTSHISCTYYTHTHQIYVTHIIQKLIITHITLHEMHISHHIHHTYIIYISRIRHHRHRIRYIKFLLHNFIATNILHTDNITRSTHTYTCTHTDTLYKHTHKHPHPHKRWVVLYVLYISNATYAKHLNNAQTYHVSDVTYIILSAHKHTSCIHRQTCHISHIAKYT